MNDIKKDESKKTARASIMVAMSENRLDESQLISSLTEQGFKAAAADFGGAFPQTLEKVIEAAIVAAKREDVIKHSHAEEGAVAGACHEALTQIMMKGIGLHVGGKIGVARYNDHLSVTVFVSIGLLHLNDVAIGMGHRYI